MRSIINRARAITITIMTITINKSRFKKITFILNDQWIIHGLIFIRFYYYIMILPSACIWRSFKQKIAGAAASFALPPRILQKGVTGAELPRCLIR